MFFEYNKVMKKLGRFLAIVMLAVPMVIGALFLLPNLVHNATQTTQNGGGGANSLNSPETGEKQDILDDEKDSEVTSYERRTFAQYLTDYEVPTTLAEIGKTTVTGNGSVESPYQINSTQDFVFFANVGMSNKYFELNCDIVYNDESFDENGTPSGGDGVFL